MLRRVVREGSQDRRRRREGVAFRRFLAGVGRQIALLRAERDLTQMAAAAKAGIDISLWARLEAGEANSTILVFHDVARALGVEVAEVVVPLGGRPSARRPGRPRKATADE